MNFTTLKYDMINLFILFKFLVKKKKRQIRAPFLNVHSITARVFTPQGGCGGGSAVLTAQKIILGTQYNDICLKYTFYEENKQSKDKNNPIWDLWVGAQLAFDNTKKERNSVYITHDYGTAFGLALLGKRYVHISHVQGSRLEEKVNLGEKVSFISALIIKFCEKYAFNHAYKVSFPSEGAYNQFCESKYKFVKKDDFEKGPILYNTIYVSPKPEKYFNLVSDNAILTFLSIGQLTLSKGIDRIPKLLAELLKKTDKKIRWICIGKGPYYECIEADCQKIAQTSRNFEYHLIKECSYPQIQYLEEISDIYIMLHRLSIFDLATLEVMKKAKMVILSKVGGNVEYNKNSNILYYNDNYNILAKDILDSDIKAMQYLNKQCYDDFFDNNKFKERYLQLIDELISYTEGEN